MRISKLIRALACAAVLAVAVTGCASLAPGTPPPPSIDRAQALEQQGDFAAAAREYEALAALNAGTAGNRYRLQASRAWLAAGSAGEATRVLQTLALPLGAAEQVERQLLEAEAALAARDPARAWATLSAMATPADPAAAARQLALRQRAAIASGRPVEGIRNALEREKRAGPAAAAALRRELLEQLRTAAESGVKLEPRAAGNDAIVRGWLEAGAAAAQAGRGSGAAAVSAWRGRYPGHPATEALRAAQQPQRPPATPAAAPRPMAPGEHVALLLPVTGRNAAAGQQVRDGILAAFYAEPAAARPRLRIYDTGSRSVAEALDEAVGAGAGFVIGPLARDEVVAAAAWSGRRPPLLALNFLQPDSPTQAGDRFYQFALSPEDEARLAARRAVADGRRRAVALVPGGDWGSRVLGAFRTELEAAGGQLVGSTTYEAGSSDLSGPLQSALRLADSRARHKRLESALGTSLSFQPRRRGDVDFLFTPAPAATARRLRPQLRFHYAGDIPAYATSDSFEPAGGNGDLDGLTFPDMPWVLRPTEGASATLRTQATQAWGEANARSRGRLFAFGHDAWLLQRSLRAGTAGTVDGASGRLSVDPAGYVRRELDWAVVRAGTARLLE
jgi:outer membrane PBP1 activator LpoA protein